MLTSGQKFIIGPIYFAKKLTQKTKLGNLPSKGRGQIKLDSRLTFLPFIKPGEELEQLSILIYWTQWPTGNIYIMFSGRLNIFG
jgi:hypothetical protein